MIKASKYIHLTVLKYGVKYGFGNVPDIHVFLSISKYMTMLAVAHLKKFDPIQPHFQPFSKNAASECRQN